MAWNSGIRRGKGANGRCTNRTGLSDLRRGENGWTAAKSWEKVDGYWRIESVERTGQMDRGGVGEGPGSLRFRLGVGAWEAWDYGLGFGPKSLDFRLRVGAWRREMKAWDWGLKAWNLGLGFGPKSLEFRLGLLGWKALDLGLGFGPESLELGLEIGAWKPEI